MVNLSLSVNNVLQIWKKNDTGRKIQEKLEYFSTKEAEGLLSVQNII